MEGVGGKHGGGYRAAFDKRSVCTVALAGLHPAQHNNILFARLEYEASRQIFAAKVEHFRQAYSGGRQHFRQHSFGEKGQASAVFIKRACGKAYGKRYLGFAAARLYHKGHFTIIGEYDNIVQPGKAVAVHAKAKLIFALNPRAEPHAHINKACARRVS